jgi:hypothetical protein
MMLYFSMFFQKYIVYFYGLIIYNKNMNYEVNTQNAISETLDGETIIINLKSGNYYSMNKAGTAVWDAILARHSINPSSENMSKFINFLLQEDLILKSTETASSSAFDDKEFVNPKIEKYEEMREMLLADPIHDVAEAGWPKLKDDK